MMKAVIFDLGGVIVGLDFAQAYARIGALTGYAPDEARQRVLATGLVEPFEMGQVDPREFARKINNALGLTVSFDDFCQLWSSIFPSGALIEESLLETLHRHYRLVLLSNTNAIHFPYVRAHYPQLGHFDDFVLSYQLGAMKPAPRIYHEAITRAGSRPEECFFVDDMAENVEAARRQGMDAEQFLSAEKLVRDLKARGAPL